MNTKKSILSKATVRRALALSTAVLCATALFSCASTDKASSSKANPFTEDTTAYYCKNGQKFVFSADGSFVQYTASKDDERDEDGFFSDTSYTVGQEGRYTWDPKNKKLDLHAVTIIEEVPFTREKLTEHLEERLENQLNEDEILKALDQEALVKFQRGRLNKNVEGCFDVPASMSYKFKEKGNILVLKMLYPQYIDKCYFYKIEGVPYYIYYENHELDIIKEGDDDRYYAITMNINSLSESESADLFIRDFDDEGNWIKIQEAGKISFKKTHSTRKEEDPYIFEDQPTLLITDYKVINITFTEVPEVLAPLKGKTFTGEKPCTEFELEFYRR